MSWDRNLFTDEPTQIQPKLSIFLTFLAIIIEQLWKLDIALKNNWHLRYKKKRNKHPSEQQICRIKCTYKR